MHRRTACTLPVLALLPACASRREIVVDPTLFPPRPAAPAGRTAGAVALRVQADVRDQVHAADRGPTAALRIPIGLIVVQALQSVADDVFAGGLELVDPAAPPRHAATLALQAVRVAYQDSLLWLVPIPVLGVASDSEFDVRLAVDVSLIDAQGRAEWTRSYDDGRQVWPHHWTEVGRAQAGLVRLTHEAAWRLAQRAVADLRVWIEADRLRPRSL